MDVRGDVGEGLAEHTEKFLPSPTDERSPQFSLVPTEGLPDEDNLGLPWSGPCGEGRTSLMLRHARESLMVGRVDRAEHHAEVAVLDDPAEGEE